MTHYRAKSVLFVVAMVVVSVGGAVGMADTDTSGESVSRSTMSLQQVTTNVTFENQTSNGTAVTVASANLSEGGFVSIHTTELLNGSVLGSILGTSAYLEPGSHENVTVALNESITESGSLIAVAYQDTNGNEEYDFIDSQGQADGAYVVENQVVLDSAEVTYDPTLTETPEPTTEIEETTEAVETTEVVATTEEVPVTTEAPETTEEPVVTTELPGTTTTVETTEEPVETTTEVPETETETPDSERAQSFRVDETDAPVTTVVGETVTVTAVISNPTDAEATQQVELRLEGDVVAEQSVTLEGGAETTVEFELDTDDLEPGTYIVEVFSEYFGAVRFIAIDEPEVTTEGTPSEA